MKKQLLTTSAILTAVVLAAASSSALAQKKSSKPSATVNGYIAQGLQLRGGGDTAAVGDTDGLDAFGDSEIHFNARGALDSGIKLHARVELESSSEDGHIDEQWLRIQGSFGQVIIGQEDSVGQLMTTGYVGSWVVGVGQNLCFDKAELVPTPSGFNHGGANFCVRLDGADSDDQKISYVTPRFSGFQVGASYARDLAANAADDTVNQDAAAGFIDYVAIAANFDRKFDNMRVAVAAGYNQADKPKGLAASKDTNSWLVSGRVDFGGFKIAGGFYQVNDQFDGNGVTTATSDDGSGFDVGVGYQAGPNAFGLAYFSGDNEGTVATAGDDEVDALWLTYKRDLGPGVSWRNTLAWVDWDDEGTAAANQNDGYALSTMIQMVF